MSASLRDKIAQFSLEIDDKTKTIELLRNLVEDQTERHAAEAAKFDKEKQESLDECIEEWKEQEVEKKLQSDALKQKKALLASEVDALAAEKEETENHKRMAIDVIKREITEEKDLEHKAYMRERADRESKWFNGRKEEIETLTIKGIQPTIERLIRKHRDNCEELKHKTTQTKQKLEIQCENDVLERIDAFRRNEQQSNTGIARKNDFGYLLSQEQNEHAANLMKTKETLMREIEATKKANSLELETLQKEHEAALKKVKTSKSMQNLVNKCANENELRRQELEARLERIGKDDSKRAWEEEWNDRSKMRMDELNQQKMKDLLEKRESRIKNIIRSSVLKEASYSSPPIRQGIATDEQEESANHNRTMEEMQKRLNSFTDANCDLESKLSVVTTSAREMIDAITRQQQEEKLTVDKLAEVLKRRNRKQEQKGDLIEAAHDKIDHQLDQFRQRKEDLSEEISRMLENHREEERGHRDNLNNISLEHDTNFDELEKHAAEKSRDIDEKLKSIKKSIEQQEALIKESCNLYKKYQTK